MKNASLKKGTGSGSQSVLQVGQDLTPETSGRTTICDESQTVVEPPDVEKLLIEETTALKQVVVQLGQLEQLCHEQLSWKEEKLKSLQSRLEETKGTLRNLCQENVKVAE